MGKRVFETASKTMWLLFIASLSQALGVANRTVRFSYVLHEIDKVTGHTSLGVPTCSDVNRGFIVKQRSCFAGYFCRMHNYNIIGWITLANVPPRIHKIIYSQRARKTVQKSTLELACLFSCAQAYSGRLTTGSSLRLVLLLAAKRSSQTSPKRNDS